MTAERLQKILARCGIDSRRKVEELIEAGRVTVNGQVARLGDRADPASDSIKVDGKRVRPPLKHRYLLLNKPRGYVTTRSDPQGRPTVFDLVPAEHRRGLIAVGRLDYQSEGLLLLTDDGDLAQRVAHPSHGCRKTYAVKVKGQPSAEALARVKRGMVLDGRRTAPVRVERLLAPHRAGEAGNTWWSVELAEGRTRQIREMFFRVGHPVQKLRRVRIGPLADPKLRPGGLRALAEAEVERLRGGGRRARPAASPGRRRAKAPAGRPRARGSRGAKGGAE